MFVGFPLSLFIGLDTGQSTCVTSANKKRLLLLVVGSPTSTRDKINLQYISECKSYPNRFCKVELDLKFTS